MISTITTRVLYYKGSVVNLQTQEPVEAELVGPSSLERAFASRHSARLKVGVDEFSNCVLFSGEGVIKK